MLASIPFVRMIQAARGDFKPIWRDTQIRAYLRYIFYAVAIIVLYRLFYMHQGADPWDVTRETTFNVITIFSGTGFASTNVLQWGHLPFALLFCVALIGGCTGSTGCSVKIFRYQVLFQAIRAQIKRMQSPHRLYPLRLEGKRLDQDVVDSVMSFFTLFILTFGLLIVGLALTGLHPRTALTGAWTAIANVGAAEGNVPALGEGGKLDPGVLPDDLGTGTGDVTGPASPVANGAAVVWDGITGRALLTRLLGVLLAALSVQFVVDGVKSAFAG